MSGTYRVLYRRGRGEEEDEEAQIELTEVRLDSEDVVADDMSGSDGEMLPGAKEDRKSLIKEPEIDENGVVRDYEVVLKHLGFGVFHWLLMVVNGVALMSDAVEVLSVSFILPLLREKEEFGVTDSQNALLSSVIFIGMLFGSYCWGGFADVVGRRTVLLLSLTLNGAFGFFSAFSTNIWMFIVFRFVSGLGVGGSLPVIGPYTAEFILNKYRGPYLSIQSFFWTFGRFICGGLAWVILPRAVINLYLGGLSVHSWRLYIALTAIPSLLGALLFFLLPESPRFLLEIGEEEKALKVLRKVHSLNQLCCKRKQFPVKGIQLSLGGNRGLFDVRGSGCRRRLNVFYGQWQQVFSHTTELFSRRLLRRTILLLIILFCLAFGSYGILLWFPSYVQLISERQDQAAFTRFCHRNTSSSSSSLSLPDYCGCVDSIFSHHTLSHISLHNFRLKGAEFSNVAFRDVSFSDVDLESCSFTACQFENVTFTSTSLRHLVWNGTTFNGVVFNGTTFCNGSVVGAVYETGTSFDGEGVSGDGVLVTLLEGDGDKCDAVEVECEEETSDKKYRDDFLIAGSSFPGNVVSAIAVYFLKRNRWMAIILGMSTISIFALYLVQSEVYVVLVLCIFTFLSSPAWNDSGLLIAELYPTHLRSTSMGIHLLSARVGAILGTNLFGLFIHVNISIPILLVAGLLLVGTCAAIPLPTTTRHTHLQ